LSHSLLFAENEANPRRGAFRRVLPRRARRAKRVSHISRGLSFSTRFQFGDHVGIGYRFETYDLSLRLQQLSSGGIASPNPGINFLALRVHYHLR
jgi:hypothetical protein